MTTNDARIRCKKCRTINKLISVGVNTYYTTQFQTMAASLHTTLKGTNHGPELKKDENANIVNFKIEFQPKTSERRVYTQPMEEKKPSCICNRDVSLLACRFCGFFMTGRLAKPCTFHPRVTFVMDIRQCPKCKSYVGMEEHPARA